VGLPALGGLYHVAVSTADFALLDFCQGDIPSAQEKAAYVFDLFSLYVIELKDNGVLFSTIYARVNQQIVVDSLMSIYHVRSAPRDSPRFRVFRVLGVPLGTRRSHTLLASGEQAALPCLGLVKLRDGFGGLAAGTGLHAIH
jgi:hypothetical protein